MSRRFILATAATWLVLSLILVGSGAKPALLVLAAIIALIAAMLSVALDLGRSAVAVDWPTPLPLLPVDGSPDNRAKELRASATGAAQAKSTTLHDTLVDLVDQRLLLTHGINRATDPERAELILPDSLRRLTEGPNRRISNATVLSSLLTDIEKL